MAIINTLGKINIKDISAYSQTEIFTPAISSFFCSFLAGFGTPQPGQVLASVETILKEILCLKKHHILTCRRIFLQNNY